MTIQHLFFGAIAIALGVTALRYNYQLVNMTGRQDWIESKLGSGSTYLAYKLFSLVIIIGGILYFTGLGTPVFQWLLSPLNGVFSQK